MGDLPSGRELDALVAEKVMGWTNILDRMGVPPNHGPWSHRVPSYSTDLGAAWTVVEKLIATGHIIELSNRRSGTWKIGTWQFQTFGKLSVGADADTAPLAICRAALKAVGHD